MSVLEGETGEQQRGLTDSDLPDGNASCSELAKRPFNTAKFVRALEALPKLP